MLFLDFVERLCYKRGSVAGDIMHKLTHDMAVHFRAASFVMAEAEKKARAQGMSLSEYLRHLVRRDALGEVR